MTVRSRLPERATSRIAVIHMLDCANRITRIIGHDLDTAVVYLALAWENVRDTTFPAANETCDEAEALLAARRPVSVYKLSRLVKMPYETTRRHIGRLAGCGLCEKTDEGVVAPSMMQPQGRRLRNETWATTLMLIEDMSRLGLSPAVVAKTPAHQLERRISRLSVRYLLDGLATITGALKVDLLSTLLFMEINRQNFMPEIERWRATGTPATPGLLADEARKPVSTYQLSRDLNLPYETTRRHVAKLVSLGLCERIEGEGLIIPASVLESPRMTGAAKQACGVTRQFLESAAGLGMAFPTEVLQAAV